MTLTDTPVHVTDTLSMSENPGPDVTFTLGCHHDPGTLPCPCQKCPPDTKNRSRHRKSGPDTEKVTRNAKTGPRMPKPGVTLGVQKVTSGGHPGGPKSGPRGRFLPDAQMGESASLAVCRWGVVD